LRVGNYTLTNLLGRGGTSEVYAAEHRFLGDAVAVKLLRRAVADDTTVRDAFVEEAARTREIQHPNVVRVIDFGHDDTTGSCYLVMERIEGEALGARLQREGRIAEPVLRELAARIADGMQAAHARGIVHRDLKPGNVMLRGDVPTIVDFGIAKSLGATTAAHTERRIGTVAYMAPEQLIDGLITPAVDIWALGVMLYECATGQLPFGNFNDGRLPQLFDTAPRASTLAPISPALERLIDKCLERDPYKRPASMAEVARALRAAVDADGERLTEDLGAKPVVRVQPATRAPRRWPIIAVAGTLVAGGVIAFVITRDTPREPQRIPMTAVPIDAAAAPVEEPPAAPQEASLPPPPAAAAKPAPLETKPVHKRPKSRTPTQPTGSKKKTSQGETLD
jgi:serine/threonine-protein kinase